MNDPRDETTQRAAPADPTGAPPKAKRQKIPVAVRDEVLREAGYMCGNPRCRHILTLELHHMEWVKDGGSNDPTNLIALCPNCHSLHTAGHIPREAIRHWKGILHALNHAFSRESMDLLLFLKQWGLRAAPIWFSGDGILKFSGLIASGFAYVTETRYAEGVKFGSGLPTNPMTSSHRVALTFKGEALVDAWLAGDEVRYREALATPPVS
jgi:hypothetical protein